MAGQWTNPDGTPTAVTPTSPAPLNSNGTPVSNTAWVPSALGGKGAWVTTLQGGTPIIFGVDPKTGIASGGGGTDINGTPIADNSTPDGKGGWTPPKTGINGSGIDPIGAVESAASKAKNYVTNTLDPSVPNPANSPDAAAARALGKAYSDKALNYVPGTSQAVTADKIAGTTQDQTQSDQARQIATANLQQLQGVANGTTRTAADALLTQGTDAAAARARGLAAAYSRSNPGAALRSGLAAGNTAQNAATAQADQLKAQEQATATGQIGTLSDAIRTQDATIAAADQASADAANKANQSSDLTARTANQSADLTQKNIDTQAVNSLGTLGNNETNAPIAADIANTVANTENNKTKQTGLGSLATAGGDFLKILSDKRAKKDIAPRALADAYADKIHGASYSYKPGEGDGGKHVGVMADEIAKVIPGAVKKDARGMKVVDTPHVTMANTALLGELARRLREIDGGKKAKGRA